MLLRFPARLAAPTLALLAQLAAMPAAQADSPYPGWRGHYGTPYTAYKAGASFDDDRRALDGSYRTPPPLPPPGTWTGLYLGAHLGGGVGGIDTANLASAEIDLDGLLGGGHAGYNMQFGNWVAGLEVDATAISSSEDDARAGAASLSGGSDWVSSARLRLGYATGEWLIYATGGLALGDIDLSVKQGGTTAGYSETMVGYAVGGGVEYQLTDSWIARVEAIHYGFAEEEFKSSLGTLDADTDVTTIRAGLSLKLN